MFEDIKSFFSHNNRKQPGISADDQSKTNYFSFPQEPSKPSIIVVANQKGGCGKTTTTINLAAGLADRNLPTLIIDLDAQAHASLGLGIGVEGLAYSLYDVIVKNVALEQAIVPTHIANLDIVSATPILTGAQLEIADLLGRELILRTAISKMINLGKKQYAYIIIDCSPSLNLLTINGLAAAEWILVPLQTHYFALEGMRELFSTITIVKERLSSQLEILGVLPTLFDPRTRMSKEILSQIREYFKEKVFDTNICMNIKLAEAQMYKKSIFEYNRFSSGARNYAALTEEVISRTRPQSKTEVDRAKQISSLGIIDQASEIQQKIT